MQQFVTLTFWAFIFFMSQTQAGLIDKKIGTQNLFDMVTASGAPSNAVQRAFEFHDLNSNKRFQVKESGSSKTVEIANKNYMIIIDFTKPSSQRRLYFINLETGVVDKYYVAHGLNTGGDEAVRFSNIVDSKQSSLGLYLTGQTYSGKYGTALKLYGLENSNDKAFERAIVMHGAEYVSLDFLNANGRMGRSFGCPAVSLAIAQKIIPLIKNGAVISMHHENLMQTAHLSPQVQVLDKNIMEITPSQLELDQ